MDLLFIDHSKKTMDPDIAATLVRQDKKLDAIYESVEKTRKYFKTTLIVTVVAFILPLIGLLFAIPSFIKSYSSVLGSF